MKKAILSVSLCLILLVLPSPAQLNKKTTKTPAQNLKIQNINQLLESYAKNNLFNGSVLVQEKGKVIFKKGYGLANMEWNIPNSVDTKFRIGSITKQFTAMLVLQLKQEGKLNLQAKITDYLPWY